MIDVGFIYEPPKLRDVVIQEVMSVPLVLVSSQQNISVDEAISQGYIRVEWGTTFATMHESLFPQRPLAPVRVNSGRVALNLLLNCGGAAYLPEKIVNRQIDDGLLYLVEQAPIIDMKAYAAYSLYCEHRGLIAELLKSFE